MSCTSSFPDVSTGPWWFGKSSPRITGRCLTGTAEPPRSNNSHSGVVNMKSTDHSRLKLDIEGAETWAFGADANGIGGQGLLRFLQIRCPPPKKKDEKHMCKREKVWFYGGILSLKKKVLFVGFLHDLPLK